MALKCAWTSDATSKENRLPEAGPPWGPLGSKKGHPMVKESRQVQPGHQEGLAPPSGANRPPPSPFTC